MRSRPEAALPAAAPRRPGPFRSRSTRGSTGMAARPFLAGGRARVRERLAPVRHPESPSSRRTFSRRSDGPEPGPTGGRSRGSAERREPQPPNIRPLRGATTPGPGGGRRGICATCRPYAGATSPQYERENQPKSPNPPRLTLPMNASHSAAARARTVPSRFFESRTTYRRSVPACAASVTATSTQLAPPPLRWLLRQATCDKSAQTSCPPPAKARTRRTRTHQTR